MAERTASDTHDPAVHFSACKQDDFQGKEQGPSEHHKAAQKSSQADGAGTCSHRNHAWVSCACHSASGFAPHIPVSALLYF